MKHYILSALALASVFLAGCNSDSSSSECTNDEVKADCADGKYSKCVDGKWTETACENNVSCNAENKCGICADGAEKADCADGKYSRCVSGNWTETACENNVSCNAENKCGECTDGDEKADCADGKYSKCVNGKWTETACENNASCNAENKCGVCQNDDVKNCENGENGVGMVTICKDGQWSENKVECPSTSGKVSCTADKQCGECLSGDTKNCTNDTESVLITGSAIMCKNGKWGTDPEYCPGQFSCAMTDACYQCYYKCDSKNECREDCKDSTCQESCKKNEACKKECDTNNGGCESKCGECNNGDNINCTEDSNKVGSADICFNGTMTHRSCKSIRGYDASCMKICTKAEGENSCNEDEYDSVCGHCLTQEDLICIDGNNNPYTGALGIEFANRWQLVKCKAGKLLLNQGDEGYLPCMDDCNLYRDACMDN